MEAAVHNSLLIVRGRYATQLPRPRQMRCFPRGASPFLNLYCGGFRMGIDWTSIDRFLFGQAWTGSRIAERAGVLCEEIGPRWATSPAERRAAERIREVLLRSRECCAHRVYDGVPAYS